MELFVDIPLLNTTMMRRSPIPLLVLLPLVNYCMMQECEQTKNDFMICSKQAHKDFIAAVTAGDDGRPDWMDRMEMVRMTDSSTTSRLSIVLTVGTLLGW